MFERVKFLRSAFDIAVGLVFLAGLIASCIGNISPRFGTWALPLLMLATALLAMRLQFSQAWRTFAFSLWVISFVLAAFYWPVIFQDWPTGPAQNSIPRLIQIIMFGMGTTLCLGDFTRVLLIPKSISVGMLLQFSVMPLAGWALAKLFGFPPEIAAGVVLIGACPGGVASNVIAYLARGDVALSVTMTVCSTLMAPVMTPLAMKILTGSEIDVPFAKMMWSILEITIAPVIVGLLVSYLVQWMRWRGPWLDRSLSAIAMLAICIVIGIIVAQSRGDLLHVGAALVVVAILHNAIGFLAGYWLSRAVGMDEISSRTISIEVGMQNGGLATALALQVLHSPPAALAGAIFGPWMSISGSVLASWWRRTPVATV
ncbi:MAG: bile acid:sodium symporter family protein [Aureliella sp.]